MPDQPSGTAASPTADYWHQAYLSAQANFAAETLTTSYLVRMLRAAQTPCERCGQRTGAAILVLGDGRWFVCDICAARTPEFTERLRRRIAEDQHILDRLADDRPIRVKDTAKYPPREQDQIG